MSDYLRAREIIKKPVVTLGGEAVAQIKDVVFDAARGDIRAFTLSGRGLLAGPMKRALSWKNVHALGPDAVIIPDETAMEDDAGTATEAQDGPGGGNVLGARMLTASGSDLGKINDVIVQTGKRPRVVGYQIETADTARQQILVPVLKPVSVSGEMVVVPDATAQYTAGDLAGLTAAAQGLHNRLEQEK
ncbi:PRC-barrel domain-containing protein [Streptomyces flavidovirens]|uniref:PRC-barrel domain-containing protein n=1 Tax=Streptomyces flavidovirens TaxID=67298 RepID=UPI0004171D64|nr:PRC-barrel domain-containing protein [Streptomyces flavidovirens]